MASFNWQSRAKAALIHLSGSVAVAALAATLVFLLWYPWPYSALAGGSRLFVLISAVDVVMGPVITFAIFDRSKPWRELRRDLAIVVLLQAAALAYGVATMYQARPVVLALEEVRFRIVPANGVLIDELPLAPSALQQLSILGPVTVRAEVPADPNERIDAVQIALAGHDIGTRPRYWRSWDQRARQDALNAGRPLSDLRLRYPARQADLDAAIARTGKPEQQLRYVPILSRFADWVALIDAGTGDVIGFAPFNAY